MRRLSHIPLKKVRITTFYNCFPPGLEADVIKIWHDPSGCKWYKLFLGYNASGQKLSGSKVADCTEDM